jgi:hypothetical protein
MKGSTGFGELGVSFRLSSESPLSLELGAQGYTGNLAGLAWNAMPKLEF